MENKERFLEIYNQHIKRDGADKLLEWLENSDFFYAPASTRFHGAYDGGLLEHSLNVYDMFRKRIKEDDKLKDVSDESIAIVSLLHDVCKVNFYKKGFRNVKENGAWVTKDTFEIDEKFPVGYHADKSVILLLQFIKLTPDEMLAIRAHMGGFDNAFVGGAKFINGIFDNNRFAVHLHIADMEASYLLE